MLWLVSIFGRPGGSPPTLCLKHLSEQQLEEPCCWPTGWGGRGSGGDGGGGGERRGEPGRSRLGEGRGERLAGSGPDSSGLQALCPQTAVGIRKTGSIRRAWLKLTAVCILVPAAQKQSSPFPANQVTDARVLQCTSLAAVVIWP